MDWNFSTAKQSTANPFYQIKPSSNASKQWEKRPQIGITNQTSNKSTKISICLFTNSWNIIQKPNLSASYPPKTSTQNFFLSQTHFHYHPKTTKINGNQQNALPYTRWKSACQAWTRNNSPHNQAGPPVVLGQSCSSTTKQFLDRFKQCQTKRVEI